MTAISHARPAPDEYAPFYARYVAAVPEGDPVALLTSDLADARAFYASLGEARAAEPYAPGKWTPKDVLLHVSDTERVMAYRALRIARGDATPLPGYDQDAYALAAGAARRPLESLLAELDAVRGATVALFAGLDDEALRRRGTANGSEVSARGLLYIVLGHERHHRRVLREHLAVTAPAAG